MSVGASVGSAQRASDRAGSYRIGLRDTAPE